jgi:hypothetical protein
LVSTSYVHAVSPPPPTRVRRSRLPMFACLGALSARLAATVSSEPAVSLRPDLVADARDEHRQRRGFVARILERRVDAHRARG